MWLTQGLGHTELSGHKDACLGRSPEHLGEPVSRRKLRQEPLGNGEGCSDRICFQGRF